jgi:hypothetical protein
MPWHPLWRPTANLNWQNFLKLISASIPNELLKFRWPAEGGRECLRNFKTSVPNWDGWKMLSLLTLVRTSRLYNLSLSLYIYVYNKVAREQVRVTIATAWDACSKSLLCPSCEYGQCFGTGMWSVAYCIHWDGLRLHIYGCHLGEMVSVARFDVKCKKRKSCPCA